MNRLAPWKGKYRLQFSLAHLLLVFPAWILAYFLAIHMDVARVTYRHDIAANGIRHIRLWATLELEKHVDLEFAEYDTAALWSGMNGNRDPWGNPYQIVELDRRGMYGLPSTFHVYSLGEDGKSDSSGNDPDDINSWNFDVEKHYGRRVAARHARESLWRTLWLTPIVYAVCLFVFHSFSRQ